jgi:hypothetical protein
MTGHLPLESHYHRRMDRIVFASSIVAWVALIVLLIAGVIQ